MKRPWLFIIILIVVLAFISFVIAGIASFFISSDVEVKGSGNVAIIPIKGELVTEEDFSLFAADVVSSTDIIELIEKAEDSASIKAIVFEINSPGGSAVASEEVANAVKKVNKPKVAWIRESGASGAYWVASATDHIVASRMSITGSIGVIASYLDFSGLMDYYNVTYERLVAGKYKDAGTPFRELTPEERAKFQYKLDLIHQEFINEVAENRQMSKAQIEAVATGEFFLGSEALELGLIDEVGSKDEALAYLEKQLNQSVSAVEYKKHRSFFDAFSDTMNEKFFYIGKGIASFSQEKKLYIRT
ncbi:signal peptide peptidase SppA [Candidatus Woesearchaeota archaeon]|nr:signal peptide peptidase SppA [Candidatus Woesearchaeota archaeon]